MKHLFLKIVFLLFALVMILPNVSAQEYKTATRAAKAMNALTQTNASKVKVHKLAQTFSGHQFSIYEFGTETHSKEKLKPAIFIMANAEGNVLVRCKLQLRIVG